MLLEKVLKLITDHQVIIPALRQFVNFAVLQASMKGPEEDPK